VVGKERNRLGDKRVVRTIVRGTK